jgi:hypothetical protein
VADGFIAPLLPSAKQVPVAYGIKKLQISCVVEDDKIGTDFLEESITAFEDYVSVHDSAYPFTNVTTPLWSRFKVWILWPSTKFNNMEDLTRLMIFTV